MPAPTLAAAPRKPARAFAIATVFAASTLAISPACSQGEGEGRVVGSLEVPTCWTGAFDFHPDFLADVPYRNSNTLRIQSGSDFQTFSDGLSILVTDRTAIRPDPNRSFAGRYGEALRVALPPEVTPPGVPIRDLGPPALVNMTLYLERTCRTQNVTLQAVDRVTLGNDGSCGAPELYGADPTQGCAPDKTAPEGVGTGSSLIAFTSLSNGKLDEKTAAQRLNAGCFDIYFADPREAEHGPNAAPPPCRGHLRGSFSFYFERGRPSQRFP